MMFERYNIKLIKCADKYLGNVIILCILGGSQLTKKRWVKQ